MKKIFYLLFIIFILGFVLACRNGLLGDPRLYNKKPTTSNKQVVSDESGFVVLSPDAVDPFDLLEKWYNKGDANGDGETDSDISFPASEFENLQITGKFGSNNEPSYTLVPGGWNAGNAETNESTYSGPNTEGQGWSISGVTYFRYKGKNQLYSPTGNYNTQLQTTAKGNPKLSRFYFYRFTGKGGGVQWLDNCLVAIDSYSKLVFAYGAPYEANGMGAPTAWQASDGKKHSDGKRYNFYEYDPVGYARKTGDGTYEVVMYDWFTNQVRTVGDGWGEGIINPRYAGRVSGPDAAEARKTPDGAGRSPFNATDNKALFTENLKNLSSQKFQVRPKWEGGENGETLYTYSISADGKTITRTEEKWTEDGNTPSNTETTYTYKESDSAVLGVFTTNSSEEYTVELVDNFSGLKLTKKDSTDAVTAVLNFTDPGPDFWLRVKDKTYTHHDGGETTKFEEKDGRKVLIWNNSDEYTFVEQDSTTRAVFYQDKSWGALPYYGIRLGDGDDNSATNIGNVLYWTGGDGWASASTTPTSNASEYMSYLNEEIAENATFADYVKNKTFKYRNISDNTTGSGKSLSLYSITFDSTGTSATMSEEKWLSNDAGQTFILTSSNNNGSDSKTTTFTVSGQTVNFTLEASDTSNPNRLDVLKITGFGSGSDSSPDSNWNGTYQRGFQDPGPVFLDRVKGTTFQGNDSTKYVFNDDGKQLTWTYKNWYGSVKTNIYTWSGYEPETNEGGWYGGYLIHLYDTDSRIRGATVATTYDLSVMEYEACRQFQ